jgi:conjugal transfer mating pair stabilization protein TraG
MSIAGQATSMLAPAQNAAEAAALEQTTGNYSYGNVSWANATSNMRQSDQWSVAPSFMGGAPSVGWRQDNGAVVSGFGNGQDVIDTSPALSRLAFTPTMDSGTVAEWRVMASEAHRQAQAYENAANDILTSTRTDRSTFGTSTESSRGFEAGSGRSANTNVEKFDRTTGTSSQGTEDRSSIGENQRITEGRDRRAISADAVSGGISGQVGAGAGRKTGGTGGEPGLSLPIGGSLGVSKTGTQQDSLSYGSDRTRSSDSTSTSSSGVRDERSNGTGASTSDGTYDRSGVFSRSSSTTSSSRSTEDALSRARSYTEAARRLDELSESLSRDASFAESNRMQFSTNLSQDFAQWYRQQQALHPNLDAPELWATVLTDQQQAVRAGLMQQWLQEKRNALWQEIEGNIQDPSLVDVDRIPIGSASDVRSSYRPSTLNPASGGGAGGDPEAAARIIEEGRRKLDDDRASSQAGRASRVGANVELQTEVSKDLNVGFFADPNLRK